MSIPATLTPIETRYRGILFRSRIEARWALFFDQIGVPWEYEAEGYKLDESTYYLPDFWMPQQDCFIEIKGKQPTEDEDIKASLLAFLSGKSVFLFYGGIPDITGPYINDSAYMYCGDEKYGSITASNCYWCFCERCGEYTIINDDCSSCCEKPALDKFAPTLVLAYNAARSARFGT